jgi:hypothetical protein
MYCANIVVWSCRHDAIVFKLQQQLRDKDEMLSNLSKLSAAQKEAETREKRLVSSAFYEMGS